MLFKRLQGFEYTSRAGRLARFDAFLCRQHYRRPVLSADIVRLYIDSKNDLTPLGRHGDLTVADLRLDQPTQVLLTGKGRKQRQVPLWPETVLALKQYFATRPQNELPSQPVFLNSHGQTPSRFGVGHLVRRYTALAAQSCPSQYTCFWLR